MTVTNLLQDTPFDTFRPGQEEVISAILSGRDTLAVLPTGSGKTLCYQLPAGIMPGLTIVVSPLVSLMDDQVTQLKMNGFQRVAALHGNKPPAEKKRIWQKLHLLKLLYVSPEMLAVEKIRSQFKKINVPLLVVDEAHCISQWGHEFRPDYQNLGRFRKELGEPVLLALTATASERVRSDIMSSLNLQNPVIEAHSVNRENIFLAIETQHDPQSRQQRLMELVTSAAKPCIIYTGTRRDAEVWSSLYKGASAYYHGGMHAEDRNSIQGQFLYNEIDVLFATSAFGMGINKPDVRSVIHGYMPPSIEQYVQEIGRAGRDGERAIAYAVLAESDFVLPWHFVEMEIPGQKWLQEELLPASETPGKLEELIEGAPFAEHTTSLLRSHLIKAKAKGSERKRIERLMTHFEQRRRERSQQIQKMTDFVHAPSCFRKQVLAYFEEEPFAADKWCCSNCHPVPKLSSALVKLESTVGWQALLKQKLHVGAEQNET
ncbi:RecQ family ATP-dependent DNA helicase [Bacillus daqingensis]|uniref:ATP-dependent DNA helicase RecQ n=1 Tax=Bacillus daqingensis TaxID=872396 RepID=A0ABV9P0X5_9BACI